ncbi:MULTISPECIES: OmpA family protein [unclassified Vibrio]|uniref:OmpA family protein n=1 Tax=unclassified Vibrio TaxID=2614977 RepID=UPI000C8364C1|nr:OmpA family protein [Vibrio sp. 10N.261.51.A7]
MNNKVTFSFVFLMTLSGCSSHQQHTQVIEQANSYDIVHQSGNNNPDVNNKVLLINEVSINEQLDHIETGRYFAKDSGDNTYYIFDSKNIDDSSLELTKLIEQTRLASDYGYVGAYNAIDTAGFMVSSSTLNPNTTLALNSIKNLYYSHSKYNDERLFIIITGHTDSSGSWQYNKQLSRDRADSAARYLMAQGVPNEALLRMAAGPDYPIAKNDSVENKAKNRRVEFFITHDVNFISDYYRSAPCFSNGCESRELQAVGYARDGKVTTNSRHIPTELKTIRVAKEPEEVRSFEAEELQQERTQSEKNIRYRSLSLPPTRG